MGLRRGNTISVYNTSKTYRIHSTIDFFDDCNRVKVTYKFPKLIIRKVFGEEYKSKAVSRGIGNCVEIHLSRNEEEIPSGVYKPSDETTVDEIIIYIDE